MTFPIDAINSLLSMVRGTVPFNLLSAIKAVLTIAEYSVSLFDVNALPMSATPELTLEKALQVVKDQHTAHVQEAESPMGLRFAYASAAFSIGSLIVHTWSLTQ